jgi:SnoaL-like domain
MTHRFADAAILAYWNGEGEETAPRTIAIGAAAIRRALPSDVGRCEVLRDLGEGSDRFIEGRLRGPGGGVDGSFVAGMQLDEEGAIASCLSFHGPAVEPPPQTSPGPPPGTARAVLDRYFERLIAGDFEAAAACFSADCLYSHPPYRPGTPRVEFRGREALRRGFEQQRGARPVRPAIDRSVQHGADCFIGGVVDGDPPGGSFISSATLDPDGLIRRYVAFYTTSRLPASSHAVPERSGAAHGA